MERLVEICCGSYEDALNAYYGRAKRIELNSALHLGGLTPSIASLKLTKKNTNLKIITMIRPRGAGFCYNDIEFEVMKEDARCMLENKADGIAFGCLNQDGSINEKQTKEMIDIIKEYRILTAGRGRQGAIDVAVLVYMGILHAEGLHLLHQLAGKVKLPFSGRVRTGVFVRGGMHPDIIQKPFISAHKAHSFYISVMYTSQFLYHTLFSDNLQLFCAHSYGKMNPHF